MPYRLIDGSLQPVSYTLDDVVSMVKEQDIRYVDLQFTSLNGRFHHVTVNAKLIDKTTLTEGFPKLDGSSVKGFTYIYESDLVLKPDPNTFAIIPWKDQGRTARMICNVHYGYTNERLSRDPRSVAERAESYLKGSIGTSYWGPEVEFFVFNRVVWDTLVPSKGTGYSIESKEVPWSNDSSSTIRLKEGYMPAEPYDTLTNFRNQCMDILNDYFHIPCEAHHHEVATGGQCEIDMHFDTLTNSADNTLTYKYVVKNVARMHGLVATMMPKPIAMDNGSGMHVNVSLWNDGRNLFYDADDEYAELSQMGRYFIGGILDHAESLCAIVAPTTNSYRRLVPGYEAPVYVAWSKGNRSAIIRVPVYFRSQEKSKRVEFRAADPSSNPYLCFSAVLAAGLDGIKRKKDPSDPIDENIYMMSSERRRALGVRQLPPTLIDAVEALKSDSDYLKPIFTQDVIDKVIELESKDYMEIKLRPHPHEFHLYFDV